MIDVCMPAYYNQDLITCQKIRWNQIDERFRIIINENPNATISDLTDKTISHIVGYCDPDFFWLKPNLHDELISLFDCGFECIGACTNVFPNTTNFNEINIGAYGFFIKRNWAKHLTGKIDKIHAFALQGYAANPDNGTYFFGGKKKPWAVYVNAKQTKNVNQLMKIANNLIEKGIRTWK